MKNLLQSRKWTYDDGSGFEWRYHPSPGGDGSPQALGSSRAYFEWPDFETALAHVPHPADAGDVVIECVDEHWQARVAGNRLMKPPAEALEPLPVRLQVMREAFGG